MMTYSREEVTGYSVGDIIKLRDGKRYRLQKKTATACAFVRHYWFDAAIDWIKRLSDDGSNGISGY